MADKFVKLGTIIWNFFFWMGVMCEGKEKQYFLLMLFPITNRNRACAQWPRKQGVGGGGGGWGPLLDSKQK